MKDNKAVEVKDAEVKEVVTKETEIIHAVLHQALFIPGGVGQLPITLVADGDSRNKPVKMFLNEGFLRVETQGVSVLVPLTNVVFMRPGKTKK